MSSTSPLPSPPEQGNGAGRGEAPPRGGGPHGVAAGRIHGHRARLRVNPTQNLDCRFFMSGADHDLGRRESAAERAGVLSTAGICSYRADEGGV